MPYRLAIFDFDGTLADSFPFVLSALDRLADRHRIARIQPRQVEELRRLDPRALIKMHNIPLWKLPLMARSMHRMMSEQIEHIPLFDGIPQALRELNRRGVTLAVVSSNTRPNILRVLGPELAGLFQYYEDRVPLFGKAARLSRLLRRSRVRPHEALCIGDELRDLQAARKTGIPFGAVAWGYTDPAVLAAHAPQVSFSAPGQLVEKIAAPQAHAQT